MGQIASCLWFDGQAEAAARFYVGLFPNSRMITPSAPTPDGAPPPVMVVWELDGQRFQGLNGGPDYRLSPAFSISVSVDGQEEVDRLWNALTADGGEESMCGWLVDRFGVSWQIVPRQLIDLMGDPDRDRSQRVTEAMLKMRKIIVADLEAAHRGTQDGAK